MMSNYEKYYKKRYKNDSEYRENVKKWVSAWAKRNRDKINKTNKKRYANRTLEQIRKQQQHLKRMRDLGRWKR